MSDYERVYKLVMLGDEAVGKTSLILQHTEHIFNQNYKMTIGTDISAKLVEIEKEGTKTNVYLIIWDIGGQDKYRILRESYLRGAAGALLVFDITNKITYSHIYNWFDESKKYIGKEVPIILLGNKEDLFDKRVVTTEEGEKLAKKLNIEFLETSAKTGKNVEVAFNKIVDAILNY
ncbi:MAG: Rab family GTPase [Promethearchaeota archaeon]